MSGMSRDKVGAADVAGFMKVVSMLKPTNVKVIAAMAMVRNSAGKDAYVADEIITSRLSIATKQMKPQNSSQVKINTYSK